MKYLGSERQITLAYKDHKTAEDAAGVLSSPVILKGSFRVVRVVKKYKTHEDSIDYNTFLMKRDVWKRENGYL